MDSLHAMTPEALLERCGLGAEHAAWAALVASLEPTPLPGLAELTADLARLGFRDPARIIGALEAMLADQFLTSLAERYYTYLGFAAGSPRIGQTGAIPGDSWPVVSLPSALPLWIPAHLATAERARRGMRERGIADRVIEATLADLGQQSWVDEQTTGRLGLADQWWVIRSWRGRLLQLGRLQCEWHDRRTVGLHIPEIGPLGPGLIDDSLDQVRIDWQRWFGTSPAQFRAESYLLDPQFAALLRPDANMRRFAERFTLTDQMLPGDEAVLEFVLHRKGISVDQALAEIAASQPRPLIEAIADHWRSGGHFHVRIGYFPA